MVYSFLLRGYEITFVALIYWCLKVRLRGVPHVCVCSTGQGLPEKRCKRYRFAISLSGLGHLDSLSRTLVLLGSVQKVRSLLSSTNKAWKYKIGLQQHLLVSCCLMYSVIPPALARDGMKLIWHLSRPEGNHLFFVPEKLCTSINLPGRSLNLLQHWNPCNIAGQISLCFSSFPFLSFVLSCRSTGLPSPCSLKPQFKWP